MGSKTTAQEAIVPKYDPKIGIKRTVTIGTTEVMGSNGDARLRGNSIDLSQTQSDVANLSKTWIQDEGWLGEDQDTSSLQGQFRNEDAGGWEQQYSNCVPADASVADSLSVVEQDQIVEKTQAKSNVAEENVFRGMDTNLSGDGDINVAASTESTETMHSMQSLHVMGNDELAGRYTCMCMSICTQITTY